MKRLGLKEAKQYEALHKKCSHHNEAMQNCMIQLNWLSDGSGDKGKQRKLWLL